jgi:alpha-ketoglutarate-dependent taurine dioxygenase
LILDNYRVLHAREKFEGYRRLRRIVIRHHAISGSQDVRVP